MSLLSPADLKELMAARNEFCVSIYLPTHRAGAEIQQDPIRLKNLVRQGEEQLRSSGVRKADAEALMEPARRLLGDNIFWQHQSDGLAIFLSPGIFRRYRVPLGFEELVVVDERFHLKPLLPLLTGDGRFYVLAVSQKKVRLLEGTRHSVGEVDLGNVPQSLAEALGYDWEERSLQFHTGAAAGGGGRPAIFHGHGVGVDDGKEEIVQFFHLIDSGLRELLNDRRTPLVVAAVDYLIPLYREVSHYPALVEEGIEGNPDELSPQELHGKAWELVEPIFLEVQEEAARRFHELLGTGRATNDLREALPAACDGRVDTLFVALGVERWGKFDPRSREVRLDGEPKNGSEDLLDLAALQALQHGGTVFAVAAEKVPGESPLAAVFRY